VKALELARRRAHDEKLAQCFSTGIRFVCVH